MCMWTDWFIIPFLAVIEIYLQQNTLDTFLRLQETGLKHSPWKESSESDQILFSTFLSTDLFPFSFSLWLVPLTSSVLRWVEGLGGRILLPFLRPMACRSNHLKEPDLGLPPSLPLPLSERCQTDPALIRKPFVNPSTVLRGMELSDYWSFHCPTRQGFILSDFL